MKEEQLIMLAASCGAIVFGLICMIFKPVAEFMNRTRTGQKWVNRLGEEKALTLNRFVIPSIMIVGGLFLVFVALTVKK